MTKSLFTFLVLSSALAAFAADPPKNRITQKEAEAIALRVAPGEIKSNELEFENKKWIYSFDIVTKTGIQEVQIDAVKGRLVSNKKETVSQEAVEVKKEANEHH